MEAVQPYGGVRHTSGQFRHSVRAVPLGEVIHIMSEWVEVRYLLRAEQSAYVLVPAVDACCPCLDAEGIQCTLVHQLIMALAFWGILRLLGQHVEAEVVAGEQIGFQPFEHGRGGSNLFRLGNYGFRFVANGVHHLSGGFLAEPSFPEFENHFFHVVGYFMFL